jgi:hypothetical protein
MGNGEIIMFLRNNHVFALICLTAIATSSCSKMGSSSSATYSRSATTTSADLSPNMGLSTLPRPVDTPIASETPDLVTPVSTSTPASTSGSISPLSYGAKCDGRYGNDGQAAAGATTLSSIKNQAAFTASDKGKYINIYSWQGSALVPGNTTIKTVNSATEVTLSNPISWSSCASSDCTKSNGNFYWFVGSDDAGPLQTTINAAMNLHTAIAWPGTCATTVALTAVKSGTGLGDPMFAIQGEMGTSNLALIGTVPHSGFTLSIDTGSISGLRISNQVTTPPPAQKPGDAAVNFGLFLHNLASFQVTGLVVDGTALGGAGLTDGIAFENAQQGQLSGGAIYGTQFGIHGYAQPDSNCQDSPDNSVQGMLFLNNTYVPPTANMTPFNQQFGPPLLSVQYTGAGTSPTFKINNSGILATATQGTDGGFSEPFSTMTTVPTLSQALMNNLPGYAVQMLAASYSSTSLSPQIPTVFTGTPGPFTLPDGQTTLNQMTVSDVKSEPTTISLALAYSANVLADIPNPACSTLPGPPPDFGVFITTSFIGDDFNGTPMLYFSQNDSLFGPSLILHGGGIFSEDDIYGAILQYGMAGSRPLAFRLSNSTTHDRMVIDNGNGNSITDNTLTGGIDMINTQNNNITGNTLWYGTISESTTKGFTGAANILQGNVSTRGNQIPVTYGTPTATATPTPTPGGIVQATSIQNGTGSPIAIPTGPAGAKFAVTTGGATGKATCWKASGAIGYCSTAINNEGSCTCN